MGISYPNIEDGKTGLKNGSIDNNIYDQIKKAIEKNHYHLGTLL